MLAPVTHSIALATIRRKRLLPLRGKVLVRAGQSVEPTDVLAEADLNPEHVVLDVARGLGVPTAQAANYVTRKVGDDVSANSIVATRKGLGSRDLRATASGRIVAIGGGQLLLEVKNEPYKLLARLPGAVVQVEPDYGAIIETTGAWVQGIWGNGQVNFGLMHALANNPEHVFIPSQVDPSLRGTVLMGGYVAQREVLEACAEMQMNGLILGSMATQLIPLALRMPYPILVLEGFGQIPMNPGAFRLLSTNAQRDVTVNAEALNRFSGQRPEIIIPLPASGEPPVPLDLEQFRLEQRVHLLRAPHQGTVGRITGLPEELGIFSSGLRAPAAEVEIEGGERVLVPLANIEVLG